MASFTCRDSKAVEKRVGLAGVNMTETLLNAQTAP
jgi:hypothetical protein